MQHPDPDDAFEDLRLAIQKLSRRIRAERAGEHVTDGQLGVLFQLVKHGDATPGQLAEREGVSPPGINRTVNALEAAGLVERHDDPDDARRVRVVATDAGRTVVEETRRLRGAWFHAQLDALPADERATLLEVLPVLQRLAAT